MRKRHLLTSYKLEVEGGWEEPSGHVCGLFSFSLSSWAWIRSSSSRRSFARTTWGRSYKQLGRVACTRWSNSSCESRTAGGRSSAWGGKGGLGTSPYKETAQGMWTVIWDLKLLLAIHQLMVLFPQSHGCWEGHSLSRLLQGSA